MLMWPRHYTLMPHWSLHTSLCRHLAEYSSIKLNAVSVHLKSLSVFIEANLKRYHRHVNLLQWSQWGPPDIIMVHLMEEWLYFVWNGHAEKAALRGGLSVIQLSVMLLWLETNSECGFRHVCCVRDINVGDGVEVCTCVVMFFSSYAIPHWCACKFWWGQQRVSSVGRWQGLWN